MKHICEVFSRITSSIKNSLSYKKANAIIIVVWYLIDGVNYLIDGLFFLHEREARFYLVGLGLVFLVRAFITIFDTRVRSDGDLIVSVFVLCGLAIAHCLISSMMWGIVYGIEIIIVYVIFLIKSRRK